MDIEGVWFWLSKRLVDVMADGVSLDGVCCTRI